MPLPSLILHEFSLSSSILHELAIHYVRFSTIYGTQAI